MTPSLPEASPSSNVFIRAASAWNRFWFTPADPTTLGLVRIFTGLVVFYVLLAYTPDLQNFFGEDAWFNLKMIKEFLEERPVPGPQFNWELVQQPPLPTDPKGLEYLNRWTVHPDLAQSKGHKLFSIWFHVADPTWMWVIHISLLVCTFCFMIGFCTRITGVLSWLGMISYIQRSPTTLFGMDTIMNVALLYLNIGPSGAALSVDRLILRYWATARALAKHLPAPRFFRPEPSISANVAYRLLQVHICFVYMASGLSKLLGASWWNGTAVWATMANYEFSPMHLKIYMNCLEYLAAHRWLWEIVVSGTTFGTLIFEISFAYLVWDRRFRWAMILGAVLLHLGIALFMGLVSFSMMMLTLVLAFVPPETVHQLLWRLGRGLPAPAFNAEGDCHAGAVCRTEHRPLRDAVAVR
jgi:hypothetical protein